MARASSQSPEPVREVRWAQSDDGTAEQFETAGAVDETAVDRVFDYGDRAVYEFDATASRPVFVRPSSPTWGQ